MEKYSVICYDVCPHVAKVASHKNIYKIGASKECIPVNVIQYNNFILGDIEYSKVKRNVNKYEYNISGLHTEIFILEYFYSTQK
jgi:hypothetical protein